MTTPNSEKPVASSQRRFLVFGSDIMRIPSNPGKTRIDAALNIIGIGSINVKTPAKPAPTAIAMSEVNHINVETKPVSTAETLSL
jgi:hypothetical protein